MHTLTVRAVRMGLVVTCSCHKTIALSRYRPARFGITLDELMELHRNHLTDVVYHETERLRGDK